MAGWEQCAPDVLTPAPGHNKKYSMARGRFTRALLAAAGSISLGLGVAGVFLPLLPTTPLLLLAAACYVRSSERMSRWLLDHPHLGPYIRDYREGRGMPLRAKVTTLVVLWLTIGISVVFGVSAFWLRLLLVAIATAVTVHLLRMKTRRQVPPDR
jgi:hypothetical protein